MTRIILARHGTTEWNEKGYMQGIKDSPLTKEGIKIAHELKKKLKKYKFDLIFSSDLLRAKKTAEIIALEHELGIKTTELLREKSFGKYEGQPYQIYNDDVTKISERLSEQKKFIYKHADDMESNREVAERFMRFVREIAITTPGQNILAVSHGSLIRSVLIKLGYSTHKSLPTGSIKNGSYVIIETDGNDFFIKKHEGIEFKNKNAK